MTYQGQDWLNAWPIDSLAKRRHGTTAISEGRCAPTRYGGMMRRLPSSQAVPQGGCEADAKSWDCQSGAARLPLSAEAQPCVDVRSGPARERNSNLSLPQVLVGQWT